MPTYVKATAVPALLADAEYAAKLTDALSFCVAHALVGTMQHAEFMNLLKITDEAFSELHEALDEKPVLPDVSLATEIKEKTPSQKGLLVMQHLIHTHGLSVYYSVCYVLRGGHEWCRSVETDIETIRRKYGVTLSAAQVQAARDEIAGVTKPADKPVKEVLAGLKAKRGEMLWRNVLGAIQASYHMGRGFSATNDTLFRAYGLNLSLEEFQEAWQAYHESIV